MKKHLPLLIFTILFSSVGFYSQTVPPESDFQFWNETQIIVPLVKRKDKNNKEFHKVTLFLNGNLRFGQNLRHFVDERIGFGFDIKVHNNVTITPSYLYQAAQPYKNRKEFESRLRFAVSLEKKHKKFSIRDRNLIEYRLRNSRSDAVRYRNRFTFSLPVFRNQKEIFVPFIADEVFYDIAEKDFTRNELSAGITKKLSPNVSADFFYLLRNNKGNTLKTVNAFGINLKIIIEQ